MRVPPIVWAGIVAIVVLGLAIALGLMTGSRPTCTSSPGAAIPPTACATVSPSASG